jgi:hypothetical protein
VPAQQVEDELALRDVPPVLTLDGDQLLKVLGVHALAAGHRSR